MVYDRSSLGYLSRAKKQLQSGTQESLLYAAFELRCGIEARMHEYLAEHRKLKRLKRQGWRIPDLSRRLSQLFTDRKEMVCRVQIQDQDSGNLIGEYVYLPISETLKSMAGKLNEHLHAMKESRSQDESWWEHLKELLESVREELEIVCQGTLLGPPLGFPGSERFHLSFIPSDSVSTKAFMESVGKPIDVGVMHYQVPHSYSEITDKNGKIHI